ncbi:hypothetical protein NUU61_005920 [Penicillium alfredii]|uniref:Uncharacterized protein n=1 Tax=Penicillium alfredii TaxID=1506179 RepID=A0A9W9K356_9EURO|nr:uncharacterized protein NUU61_005920 [Penicillium alfredii]KAJ5091050.1 hypothetical protein NUU61_005920 [Penicillium alfredii]
MAAIIAVCGVYYYVWIKVLPQLRGYKFPQTVLPLDDGAMAHRLVKIPRTQSYNAAVNDGVG